MDGNGVSSLLQFLPSFLSLMHGMNNQGQKNTANAQAQVNNAMVNPNNPLYQQMYGQYKQLGQQQLGDNISQMQGQNRMLSAMGRTPLFSPERQGEAAFRAQGALGPQIGVMAGQETQQALENASKGYNPYGQMSSYSNLLSSQYGERAKQGASNQTAVGLGQLGQFLSSNKGLTAPGGQDTSLLHMLFGGG